MFPKKLWDHVITSHTDWQIDGHGAREPVVLCVAAAVAVVQRTRSVASVVCGIKYSLLLLRGFSLSSSKM